MATISAEAAVTQQVKQDKPAKKKKSSSLQEIIREALEADRSRTFHGFQTPTGRGSYGGSSLTTAGINGNGTLTLAGGTLVVNGTIGSSTSLDILGGGTLTLSGTNTTGLPDPSNLLTFSNSSSAIWGSTLTIIGWNGNGLVTYGNSDSSQSTLSQIQFIDPSNPTNGFFFQTIPEPSVALLGVSASLLLIRRRR